jgi:protein O-mannosyl-transferase
MQREIPMATEGMVRAPHTLRIHAACFLILLAVACGVYGNSLFNGFVWDDNEIIVNNPANRDISSIGTLFGSADEITVAGVKTPYYRPLNRLTYLLDYRMFGLNPLGYHAESILIHFLAAFALYLLAWRLFGAPLPAVAAALLLTVHPVNAETVNLIAGRNNLLATLFVFLSFFAFIHAGKGGKRAYSVVAAGFFLMGLLCKETALMLLPFLCVYDITSLRSLRERIAEKFRMLLPFGICTGIYLLLRSGALSGAAGASLDLGHLGQRLAQDIYIIPRYAALLLFPARLNVNYDIPAIFTAGQWWLVPAWIALLCLLAFLVKSGRPVTRFGLLWCAVNFIPIANVVPIPSAPMADRFMYLPAVGVWLVAADQAWVLYAKSRRATAAAALLILFSLGAVTVNRNLDWRDDRSLYESSVKTAPDSSWGHYNLGVALVKGGDVTAAEREFQRAVALNPAHSDAFFQLASIRLERGSYQEAEHYLTMALREDPGNAEAMFNLALLLERVGRPREALSYYEEFLGMAPARFAPMIPRIRAKVEELRREQPRR